MSNYLLVIAHSDDEILGAGCTMLKLIEQGHNISVVCMTMEAPTREDHISKIMKKQHERIGVKKTYVYPAKALELEKANRIDVVQFIEQAMLETEADVIITHYKHDLHHDHRIVYELVMEAIRLPQRDPDKHIKRLQSVLSMEVICSTSWADERFRPTVFSECSSELLRRKIELLNEYDNVIRPVPHPRSVQGIFSLANYRGLQSCCEYAEGFENILSMI